MRAWTGGAGILLSAAGLALLVYAVRGDHEPLTVLGIALSVVGLALLRAWHWVRKERVLADVGRDLHLPGRGSEGDP